VPGLIVRVQHSRAAFDKGGLLLFHRCFPMQNNREVTKNKAALSKTKAALFRRCFSTKNSREVTKK
jgi:hypothetical protein